MNSLPKRFWDKVVITDYGCWMWIAYKNKLGYGVFGVGRKSKLAHRLSFEDRNGPIPDGFIILHSCDHPACVNPSHLRIGTNLENMKDCIVRGRRSSFTGERNPRAKLNFDQVKEIRGKYNKGITRIIDIAKEYGISKSQVWNIISSSEWKQFPEVKP